MRKDAIFHKCDFQVHTPRDIQFVGKEYITDEERAHYSSLFIKACRRKGLNAIAITDHHDLEFYNYIKQASMDELDDANQPIQESQRIVVFPGLELTLDVPCQALLIFDSTLDITESLKTQIYTALRIANISPSNASKTCQTNRLDFRDIESVVEALNNLNFLKNRFIIFPNVKDGGSDTIFREGFHNLYAKGTFVGGYLDGGQYESHSKKPGWLNIINGKTPAYGNRSIGVIQTSDNRTDTFEHLGTSTTWIKWSESTAEGIRQACLAKNSRISQNEPKLPNTFIESINIINSSYLGNLQLDFNPQLNVLIGGRGTGKSSILQYISWVLGKDADTQKKKDLDDFVGKTLLNGSITLKITKNNVSHIIERSLSSYRLKVGDEDWRIENPENISAIIKAESYSQKELSKQEKDRTNQISRLIEYSLFEKIQVINTMLNENANKIREYYSIYDTVVSRKSRLNDIAGQTESIVQQITQLQKALSDIPEDDRSIIKNNKLIENERRLVEKVKMDFGKMKDKLNKLLKDDYFSDLSLDSDEYFNLSEITSYFGSLSQVKEKVKVNLSSSVSILSESQSENILLEKHLAHTNAYNLLKQKQLDTDGVLKRIENLESQLKNLISETVRQRTEIEKHESIWSELCKLYYQRHNLNIELRDLIVLSAAEIESKSKGSLSIQITELENLESIIDSFSQAVTGSKGQPERTLSYFRSLQCGNKTYKKLLKFWTVLIEAKKDSDLNILSRLSKFKIENSSFIDNDFTRITQSFSVSQIIELSLLMPTYNINLSFHRDSRTAIPFNDASYGQQAGSILTVLLNQEIGPLIIDQPEDDLDNKVIHQITENIIQAKKHRQIIFSSHNANIAVNGDAELIICFEHNSNSSKGEIVEQGSIDAKGIKNVIKDIMEGGEKAFALRKEKYGF